MHALYAESNTEADSSEGDSIEADADLPGRSGSPKNLPLEASPFDSGEYDPSASPWAVVTKSTRSIDLAQAASPVLHLAGISPERGAVIPQSSRRV
jgi:hypothetical protein